MLFANFIRDVNSNFFCFLLDFTFSEEKRREEEKCGNLILDFLNIINEKKQGTNKRRKILKKLKII